MLWEVAKLLVAIGVLVFLYTFTCALFPSTSQAPYSTDESTNVQPSPMVYRGVSDGRSPDLDELERSPVQTNDSNIDQPKAEEALLPNLPPETPNSVVRLTDRGISYMRFR